MRMVVGVSDWPESMGQLFDIFPVKENESDEDAIQRGKDAYSDDLDVYIVDRA
jgi:hypothetical protein